jgi:predicted nuclease with TOPRIM domain
MKKKYIFLVLFFISVSFTNRALASEYDDLTEKYNKLAEDYNTLLNKYDKVINDYNDLFKKYKELPENTK